MGSTHPETELRRLAAARTGPAVCMNTAIRIEIHDGYLVVDNANRHDAELLAYCANNAIAIANELTALREELARVKQQLPRFILKPDEPFELPEN